jgi:cellulose synthase (UDP-forming)
MVIVDAFAPATQSASRHRRSPRRDQSIRLALLRVICTLTVVSGFSYVGWRWLDSLNWAAWWIAVPLVLAETYSLIDVTLFATTVWRSRPRDPAHPAPPGSTVDVYITTYDEPIELVLATVEAAQRIRYPHETWILDDGARSALAEAAERLGVGYVTRGASWQGKALHAKAGNLNNALMTTEAEFVLVLDADQRPSREILDRTLGYFDDPRVALVQTPQTFTNVGRGDPLGSEAPLFYGPIQQGKDGWNAAFFCGSNAILRREALMQLGLTRYVADTERAVARGLRSADRVIARSRKAAAAVGPHVLAALDDVATAIARSRRDLAAGAPLGPATYALRRRVDTISRSMVEGDLDQLAADMAELLPPSEPGAAHDLSSALDALSAPSASPLAALIEVRQLLDQIDVDGGAEAQPVMPMATISVTEDMATSMRLHALGWRTVYHHEALAHGLAPNDLRSMIGQRLRWAQGTVQVLLRESPLHLRGLALGQRLMYFATMWSYFSGYAALAYFAAPVIFLCFGVLPVSTSAADFFWHFLPFLVLNQLMFAFVSRGIPTLRGRQYSLVLFPVWIHATVSALANVWFGRPLQFRVTPKSGGGEYPAWRSVVPQIVVAAMLVVAGLVGGARLLVGVGDPTGTAVNLVWIAIDLASFSVLVRAARFRGSARQGVTD